MDITNFATRSLSVVYDLAPLNLSSAQALPGYAKEIEEFLELNDPAVKANRAAHFGADPEDFAEKFYDLAPGPVLAGLRHLNANREKPFVFILPGFAVQPKHLPLLQDFARGFAQQPKSFSLWLKPQAVTPLAASSASSRLGQQVWAGHKEKILEGPAPLGNDRVTLKKQPLDYAWYEKVYAELHQEKPELADYIPLSAPEDLEEALHVYVDEEFAGLIAGQDWPLLGQPGTYFTEILLLKKFRGQGLAPALQRKYIAAKGREIIWGTIDGQNFASARTAERVGRRLVQSEVFFAV
jgi:hypothetical protein